MADPFTSLRREHNALKLKIEVQAAQHRHQIRAQAEEHHHSDEDWSRLELQLWTAEEALRASPRRAAKKALQAIEEM